MYIKLAIKALKKPIYNTKKKKEKYIYNAIKNLKYQYITN